MTSLSLLARIREVLLCHPEGTRDTVGVAKLVADTATRRGLGLVEGPALSGKSIALQKALQDTATSAVIVEPTNFADGRRFGELLCRASELPVSTARLPVVHGSLIANGLIQKGVQVIVVENADRLVAKGEASGHAIHTLTNVLLEARKRNEDVGIVVVGRAASTSFANALAHDIGEPAQRYKMGSLTCSLASVLEEVQLFSQLQIGKINELEKDAPIYDPDVVNQSRQLALATGGRLGMISRLLIMAWQNAANAKQTPVSLDHFARAWETVAHDPEWCTQAYGNPFKATTVKDKDLIAVLGFSPDDVVVPKSPPLAPAASEATQNQMARTPPNRRTKRVRRDA